MKFILPNNILHCLDTLNQAGFEAFVVGGAVRDHLMDITPHDYDIATNALPADVKKLFTKTIPTGEKHGTITVILDDEPIEVTTYRADGDYQDSRHPQAVDFKKNIADDLSRRDFTVNAFAYHPAKGIVDLFNGQKDLKNKLLRTVGDATTRFAEDALRIMRAFRFASQLNFVIDPATLSAALKQAETLKYISAERISVEFCKLLCGEKPECILPLLQTGVLRNLGIQYNGNSLDIIKHIPAFAPARLALFCVLTESEPRTVCSSLRYSNRVTQNTYMLYLRIKNGPPQSSYEMRKAFPTMDKNLWQIFFDICRVLFPDQPVQKEIFDEIIEKNIPCNISDLALSGNELQTLGIQGVQIGRTLQYLLDFVLHDPQINQKDILLSLAKDFQKTI